MGAIHYLNSMDKIHSLLTVFDALMTERNVSKAAIKLHLSQPALSHALARLREEFKDELFVRVARGVAPTPRALKLAPLVAETLNRLERLFAPPERFDPMTVKSRITMASSEYFEHLALPQLVPRLAKEAPGVLLHSHSAQGRLPKEEMERGECDLAVAGFFGELPEGFYQQTLFDETFVCVVRKDHPQVGRTLSLKGYLALSHLLISMQGDLKGMIDVILEKQRCCRRIVAGIGNFITPGWIIAESDLILTLPRRLAMIYLRHLPLRMLAVPLEVPPIKIAQVWHERTNADPLHRWFRRQVHKAVQSEEP